MGNETAVEVDDGSSDEPAATNQYGGRRSKPSLTKSLGLLHAIIWGGFAALAIGTSYVMIRWEVLYEMIRLDRESAAAQTREQWEILQNQISAYLWQGELFAGGWVTAILYFTFLGFVFFACWAIVQMVSIRLVTLPRPIAPFDAFLLLTSRLLAGIVPVLFGFALVVGVVVYRLAPKFYAPNYYGGAWRILDVLGAMPVAAIIAVALIVLWIFLFPQVVLTDNPWRAWYTSARLIFKAPGMVIGRWLGYSAIAVGAVVALGFAAWWITTTLPVSRLTTSVIVAAAFILAMLTGTWVTLQMLKVWEVVTGNTPLTNVNAKDIVFQSDLSPAGFQTEEAEWEGGKASEEALIYIPTLDGKVLEISDEPSSLTDTGDSPEAEFLQDETDSASSLDEIPEMTASVEPQRPEVESGAMNSISLTAEDESWTDMEAEESWTQSNSRFGISEANPTPVETTEPEDHDEDDTPPPVENLVARKSRRKPAPSIKGKKGRVQHASAISQPDRQVPDSSPAPEPKASAPLGNTSIAKEPSSNDNVASSEAAIIAPPEQNTNATEESARVRSRRKAPPRLPKKN